MKVIHGNEIYKILNASTFHREATVGQLVDATDLPYEIVKRVVRELAEKGYLHQTGEDRLKRPEFGIVPDRKEGVYEALSQAKSDYRLEHATERRPDTPLYNMALEIIESAEKGLSPGEAIRCIDLLRNGIEFESLIPEGLEVVQLFYDKLMERAGSLSE